MVFGACLVGAHDHAHAHTQGAPNENKNDAHNHDAHHHVHDHAHAHDVHDFRNGHVPNHTRDTAHGEHEVECSLCAAFFFAAEKYAPGAHSGVELQVVVADAPPVLSPQNPDRVRHGPHPARAPPLLALSM